MEESQGSRSLTKRIRNAVLGNRKSPAGGKLSETASSVFENIASLETVGHPAISDTVSGPESKGALKP